MVINYFLYILDNTSRRAITDNSMNIKAILHAESLHKEEFYTGPKSNGLKDPDGALPHVCAVSPWWEILWEEKSMVVYKKGEPRKEPLYDRMVGRFLMNL